jgi:hypothetical protein
MVHLWCDMLNSVGVEPDEAILLNRYCEGFPQMRCSQLQLFEFACLIELGQARSIRNADKQLYANHRACSTPVSAVRVKLFQ